MKLNVSFVAWETETFSFVRLTGTSIGLGEGENENESRSDWHLFTRLIIPRLWIITSLTTTCDPLPLWGSGPPRRVHLTLGQNPPYHIARRRDGLADISTCQVSRFKIPVEKTAFQQGKVKQLWRGESFHDICHLSAQHFFRLSNRGWKTGSFLLLWFWSLCTIGVCLWACE